MGIYLGTTKIASGGVNFDDIYPIGSVYVSISGQKPAFGTWEKLAEGKCLWNTSAGGGTNIDQALPIPTLNAVAGHTHDRGTMNITGSFDSIGVSDGGNGIINCAGAFTGPTGGGAGGYSTQWTGTSYGWSRATFTASRNWTGSTSSNGEHTPTVAEDTIYKSGSNVQPAAIAVTMFKRIA